MDCVAQNTQYIGNSKVFVFPKTGEVYTAQVYSKDETIYNDTYFCTSVSFYSNGNFTTYSPQGMYLSFHSYNGAGSSSQNAVSSEQVILQTYARGISGNYAFVIQGQSLVLVKVETNEVVSILEPNYQWHNDFSIVVIDSSAGSYWNVPQIWILNNGYVKIYNDFPTTTSQNSVSVKRNNTEKKYNLGGVEVDNPTNGIYIQNSKKIIAK
jgi:hypothetical protein